MIELSTGAEFGGDHKILIEPTKFPDKTSQVWHLPEEFLDLLEKEEQCTIRWTFEGEHELVQVAQLKSLLDHYEVMVNLDMPYLPYGRQDKHVSNSKTFALQTFACLINAMDFIEVRTLDAHSFRAKYIQRLRVDSPRTYIQYAVEKSGADMILFPDAGARARYEAYAELDFPKTPRVHASKVRNQATGEITGMTIQGRVKGQKLIMIDDIADGGMTFKVLAKLAIEAGAREVHLYVTHGIFSKGLDVLREAGIGRIFTWKGEVSGVLVKA